MAHRNQGVKSPKTRDYTKSVGALREPGWPLTIALVVVAVVAQLVAIALAVIARFGLMR